MSALTALYNYYEKNLKEKFPYGSENVGLSFLIVIDREGNFKRITDIRDEGKNPEKKEPKKYLLPFVPIRTNAPNPCVLFDKKKYVFNLGGKEEICFDKFVNKCKDAYKDTKVEDILPVIKFYDKKEYEKAKEDALYKSIIDDDKVSFRIEGCPYPIPVNEKLYLYAFNTEYEVIDKEEVCSISGKVCNPIKVAMNDDVIGKFINSNNSSSDSYGFSDAYNFPISLEADFSFSTSLKYLLSNGYDNKIKLNDITYVFFSEDSKMDESFAALLASIDSTENSIKENFSSIFSGEKFYDNNENLVYILGYRKPPKGSLEIVFYDEVKACNFVKNIKDHFKYTKNRNLFGVRNIVSALPDRRGSNSYMMPSIVQAIFTGGKYPESIANEFLIDSFIRNNKNYSDRTAIETEINYLKIYLSNNKNMKYEEINKEESIPYQLGRCFAVCVKAQCEVSGAKSYTDASIFKNFKTFAYMPAKNWFSLNERTDYYLSLAKGTRLKKLLSDIKERIPNVPQKLNKEEMAILRIGFDDQWNNFFEKE